MKLSATSLIEYLTLIPTLLVTANPISPTAKDLTKRHNFFVDCGTVELSRVCTSPPYKYYCKSTGSKANSGTSDSAQCWDNCRCRTLDKCSWKGLIVSCLGTTGGITSGEVVQTESGKVIGNIEASTMLENGTLLLYDPTQAAPENEQSVDTTSLQQEPATEATELTDLAMSPRTDDPAAFEKSTYSLECPVGLAFQKCKDYYCNPGGKLDVNKGKGSEDCDKGCFCQLTLGSCFEHPIKGITCKKTAHSESEANEQVAAIVWTTEYMV